MRSRRPYQPRCVENGPTGRPDGKGAPWRDTQIARRLKQSMRRCIKPTWVKPSRGAGMPLWAASGMRSTKPMT